MRGNTFFNSFDLTVTKIGNGSIVSTDGEITCSNDCHESYAENTAVILTAIAAKGSTFVKWTGCTALVTNPIQCQISMTKASTVTATFAVASALTYNLSINKIGNGTVTSDPAGINCGVESNCSEYFTDGKRITLTAKPNTNATFTKWSGCTPLADKPLQCTITLTNAKTVTATFSTNIAPDVAVTAITLSPVYPASGSDFSATITLKNQGIATMDGGYLDVWANQTEVATCGTDGDEWVDVGQVAVGETKTLRVKLTATGIGAKTLRVFADSWCGTAESNETNNQLTKSYTVK